MTYVPRTTQTRWTRDQILMALRERGSAMVGDLVKIIGVGWSGDLYPTMVSMEKHGEIERYRQTTSHIWVWTLGPKAPVMEDWSDLEALLGGTP